jgi:hypothetical protein
MKYNGIVFIISTNPGIGILESQVFKFANYIALNYDFSVKIILIGEKIIFDKSPYLDKLEFHYLNKTISIKDIKNCKIYIRSIDVFVKNYLQLKINNNHLVYDFRALLFLESFSRRNNYFIAAIIFSIELTIYLLADEICCVSKNLRSCLFKFFLYRRKIYVFPCLVSESEIRTRSPRLSKKSVYNFVYLGSLSKWQNFNQVVDLYKQYSDNNNATLTVITKDRHKASEILKTKNVVAKVISLNNSEVLNELEKFDFGFLLRDNKLLNFVASPVKYLEYLSSGVIPIMNSGIGDYSEEAKSNNIAILLKRGNKLIKADLSKLIEDKTYNQRLYNYYNNNYIYEKNIKKHPLVN